MKESASKYISILESDRSASGKTRTWEIVNTRHNEVCGKIKWYGGFRKYVFYPTDGFLFDASCMRIVAEWLDEVNVRISKMHD